MNATISFCVLTFSELPHCKVECESHPMCFGHGIVEDSSKYSQTNPSFCAMCHTGDGETVNFTTWETKSNASRDGCNDNKYCLACETTEMPIVVPAGYTLAISSDCTRYAADETVEVHVNIPPGGKNIKIVGPGKLTSSTWPLQPGRGFQLLNNVELVATNSTANIPVAIELLDPGTFTISASAANFTSLVSVHTANGASAPIGEGSSVTGYAADAVFAGGHVTGTLTLDCTQPNQSIVLQDTVHTSFTPNYAKNSSCKQIDEILLTKLLGTFGRAYDVMFFEGPPTHVLKPIWKEARYVWYAAGTALLAVLLSEQPRIAAWFAAHKHADVPVSAAEIHEIEMDVISTTKTTNV